MCTWVANLILAACVAHCSLQTDGLNWHRVQLTLCNTIPSTSTALPCAGQPWGKGQDVCVGCAEPQVFT